MVHKRTFFIVPGFKMRPASRSFSWLKTFLRSKGFSVRGVPIAWDRRTMEDYVEEFKVFYEKHKTAENYVLGFSYGAVIAFLSANDLEPRKIYLCSLSPDFREDIPKIRSWIERYVGKRRISEMKTRSGRKFARALRVPSVVFYGEVEGKKFPSLKVRCEETVALAPRSRLVVVKDAPHDIRHPEYQKAIKTVLRPLK